MRAVVIMLSGRRRQYWKSWLALSLLVAVVGGLVLAAASTARRTAAAFPGFVARHGYDLVVYSNNPLPELARLDQVAAVTTATAVFTAQPRCACRPPIDASNFQLAAVSPRELGHMVRLLSGRMPSRSNPAEVLASYTLARDNGIRLGSVIRVPTVSPAQLGGPPGGLPGPRLALRVVGIAAAEDEFPAGWARRYDLFGTPALARFIGHRAMQLSLSFVTFRRGAAGLAGIDGWLRARGVLGTADLDADAAAVEASIRPQVIGWWLLAALAAMAGLAVLGQAIARQASVERADHPVLAALGARPADLVRLGMLRALGIGASGAAAATLITALLSPLTPLGEARLASTDAGNVAIDGGVLAVGVPAIMAAVLALSAWPAFRDARARALSGRSQEHPAPLALTRAVAAAGAPPAAVIGIRHAIEPGRGRQPVEAALLGTVLAVAASCATVIFGASLAHLIASPALYGAPFQVYFAPNGDPGASEVVSGPLLGSLRGDQAIKQITLGGLAEIKVNGTNVRAVAVSPVRGPVLISAADGRSPRRDREIILGVATMRRAGARPGGSVLVTVADPKGRPHVVRFRVTGRAALNPGAGGLSNGAALTIGGLVAAECPAGQGRPACERAARRGLEYVVLVRAAAGRAGQADLARYIRRYKDLTYYPQKPTALVNFGESVNFPLLVGIALALFGAATLVHLLLAGVTRRRREAGLLKVLGFTRRQVAAALCWQASTVALIGIIAGVPLGIAAGRMSWRLFATNFGVVPVSIVQPLLLAALAAGVLAAANLLAFWPALIAARSHPAQLLRAE